MPDEPFTPDDSNEVAVSEEEARKYYDAHHDEFTTAAADGLRRYVERGGHAVAEARLAWNDDRGFAAAIIPGAGLHAVFGLREKHVWMRREAKLTFTDSGDALKRRKAVTRIALTQ